MANDPRLTEEEAAALSDAQVTLSAGRERKAAEMNSRSWSVSARKIRSPRAGQRQRPPNDRRPPHHHRRRRRHPCRCGGRRPHGLRLRVPMGRAHRPWRHGREWRHVRRVRPWRVRRCDRGATGRPYPYLDRHRGTTVAGITFEEDEIGLRYEGRLLDTAAARDYAATIPAGNDGVSLEFVYRGAKSRRQGRTIIHTAIPRIAALAGEYVPAYEGATVALRGGGQEMPEDTTTTAEAPAERAEAGPVPMTREQIAALATDAATEVMRAYAERGALTSAPTDPMLAYASLGELVHAAGREGAAPELRAYAARALAVRVLDDTTFTSGANAALANGNLVTSQIQRLVNRGRRAITAFGGPRPLGDVAGLTLNWPYFDGTLTDFVAAQSAEKAEIISASVDIKLGTEALLTYAGGSDISYQVIRRGSPSILDAYAQIWLAAWAVVTDAAFVTELETGTVTVDYAEALASLDLTEFIANIMDASLPIDAATGRGAEFILASSTAFARLANLIAPSALDVVTTGRLDLQGLSIGIGNLPDHPRPGCHGR